MLVGVLAGWRWGHVLALLVCAWGLSLVVDWLALVVGLVIVDIPVGIWWGLVEGGVRLHHAYRNGGSLDYCGRDVRIFLDDQRLVSVHLSLYMY